MADQHQPSGNDSDDDSDDDSDGDDDDDDDDDEDYRGRIEVEADRSMHGSGNDSDESDEDYEDVDGAPLETITGIILTNNSYRPIKPLKKILEAYSSAKGRKGHGEYHQEGKFAETIGENGVGLKQGCAALSDLSFVLIRRGDGNTNRFSLGLIAERLQQPDGISLPSMEFVSDNLHSLRDEMSTLFAGTAVGECVKTYGTGSVDAGINRLISHFGEMSSRKNGGWGHFSEVFRVVLHEVKGSSTTNSNKAVLSLMNKMRSDLPSTYIHLPEDIEVKVGSQVIQFHYYQRRLIELTSFYRKIDITSSVGDGNNNWQDPDKGDYYIRLLFGFDAGRKGSILCIHSRQSGRLVKYDDDCRKNLGLAYGGSDFCQGLTIIVDDMHGHLPLNPTKQDIAFGEQGEAGDVHRRNLRAWIGGCASLYYNIHKNKFDGSKEALSAAIRHLSSQQDTSTWDGPCLDECDITHFTDITWKFIKATGNIRCGNVKRVTAVAGEDTRWRFDNLPEASHAAYAASPPRSNPRPKKKRNAEQPSEIDFKKLYEELKKEHKTLEKEHGTLKKEHKTLEKEHKKLHEKYQKKKDHKETAKKLKELAGQLNKELDIERRWREEEQEDKEEDLRAKDEELRAKDATVERLEKRNRRLEERIKSLDSMSSPRGSRQVSL